MCGRGVDVRGASGSQTLFACFPGNLEASLGTVGAGTHGRSC